MQTLDYSEIAKLCLQTLDLTSLNDNDTDKSVKKLCKKARTSYGNVAAVCIYPQFVSLAAAILKNTGVKVATVANFPKGYNNKLHVTHEIKIAISQGADEIDLVFPYSDYLAGNEQAAIDIVTVAKEACGKDIVLKVILETGMLAKPEIIYKVSREVIKAGAKFLKTSTGTISQGANIIAAEHMLKAIYEAKQQNIYAGIKLSGGIRTLEQAATYIQLTRAIMGDDWINPANFRIGASSLLEEILEKLK